jgi:predicted MFS family arabinose efflux permease
MNIPIQQAKQSFTGYQVFIIAIIAVLQFTVVLDFMVLSPLGAILLKELSIKPAQFGLVVSAYAFSAGASGLLAAGFADKFDRKKLLMFFYVGFILGTTLCAIAPDYHFLLMARIVTGLFGGVISSVSFAIITDLFEMKARGRVMGFTQMAFAASQILGIPIGLLLANKFSWHAPFWMIVGFSIIVGVVIFIYMKPVTEHLKSKSDRNPFVHLQKTLTHPDYMKGYLATILMATGGFMLMPFGSAFSTNNMKLSMDDLPLLYSITGVASMLTGPFIGKLSDKIGKYKVFVIGSVISMIMVPIYTNLGSTPLWLAVVLNSILFVGISIRIISSSALMTAIPNLQDRGAFMSVNSSIQQVSGGIATAIAGMIVYQTEDGIIHNYSLLGNVVIGTILFTTVMLYIVNEHISKKTAPVISK